MKKILFTILLSLSLLSAFDFSLEDLNSTSTTYSQNVGPSYFNDKIVFVYFGHFG